MSSLLRGILLILLLVAACARAPSLPSEKNALPSVDKSVSPERMTPVQEATREAEDFARKRLHMVESTMVARGIGDPDVLRVMRTLPRHDFVPPEYQEWAYADHALPIGYGQTISQPYIVAWMTELLDLKPGEKVLEIGTGSGYQAAVLAELGGLEVYSVEIIPELAASAAERLKRLGYTQVKLKQADGYYGWPEYAPFDAIIVTAAPDHLPAPLVAQLKEGGRLVIPIGPPGGYQILWKFILKDGELTAYNLGGVGFVPFTGPGVEQAATKTP